MWPSPLDLLPAPVRAVLDAAATDRTWAFGELPDAGAHVVREGRLRVVHRRPDGGETPVRVEVPGTLVLQSADPPTGGRFVRCAERTTTRHIPTEVWSAVLAACPGVAAVFERSAAAERASEGLFASPELAASAAPGALLAVARDCASSTVVGASTVDVDPAVAAALVVVVGRIEIQVPGGVIGVLTDGDLLAPADLPADASLRCTREATLLVVPREVLDEVEDLHPGTTAAFKSSRVTVRPLPATDDDLGPEEDDPLPLARAEAPIAAPRGRRRGSRRWPHVYAVDETDCGAACLAMVLRHHGARPAMTAVRDAVGVGRRGTSLLALRDGAEALGFDAGMSRISGHRLDDLPLPALVHWQGTHWVVLHRLTGRRAWVADPSGRRRPLHRAEFLDAWTGFVLTVSPTPRLAALPGPSRPVWLLPLLRPVRALLLLATVLALIAAAAEMAVPVLTQRVVDALSSAHQVSVPSLVAVALAGAGAAATGLVQRVVVARAAVRIDGTALDFVTGRLLDLPLAFFHDRRTADIERRLAGIRNARHIAVQGGLVALTAAAQLLVGVVVLFWYRPMLGATFVAVIPLYLTCMLVAARRLRPVLDTVEDSWARYAAAQRDTIRGIETAKALGVEGSLRRALVRRFQTLAGPLLRSERTSAAYQAATAALTALVLTGFLTAAAVLVAADRLSVGGMVAVVGLVTLSVGPLGTLAALWDQMLYGRVLLDRVDDVLDRTPEQPDRHPPVAPLGGHVELERVTVSYRHATTPSLDDVSLRVRPGGTVAIVGRSGAGKSTLVRCLAGLVPPTSGQVRYDGVDVTTVDQRTLRQRLGCVLQDGHLFDASISENIALGEHRPDPRRVRAAAAAACIDEFVATLPLGYDTQIGEGGVSLSGGQRQRLEIARALYRRPAVLVLDEPTSALDGENERLLLASLERLRGTTTVFVVAHRLSTVRQADLIVVLDRGRIVERGTHETLLERDGLYAHLVREQLAD